MSPASSPKPPAPAVVLAGYYGFGNIGDEWILSSLVRNLPPGSCAALSHRPALTSREQGVPAHNRWNVLKMAPLLRRSKAFVLGGGELFQTKTSWRSLLYYLGLTCWARLLGCRVFAFGIGIDPDLSAFGRFLVKGVLRNADSLWVRDEITARMLKPLRKPICVIPDPAWVLGGGGRGEQRERKKTVSRVLWVLRFPNAADGEVRRWSRVLNELARAAAWEHGFFAFHPEADMPALSRLRARVHFFHLLEKGSGPEDVFNIIAGYDVVVSMRYHGLLAAALARCPAVAVAAHGKVTELARELGVPCLPLSEVNARALRSTLEGLSLNPALPPESALGTLKDAFLALDTAANIIK